MELDEQASLLAEQADHAEQQLEHARKILNGQIEDPRIDLAKVRQNFDQLLKDAQGKRRRADAEHQGAQ